MTKREVQEYCSNGKYRLPTKEEVQLLGKYNEDYWFDDDGTIVKDDENIFYRGIPVASNKGIRIRNIHSLLDVLVIRKCNDSLIKEALLDYKNDKIDLEDTTKIMKFLID